MTTVKQLLTDRRDFYFLPADATVHDAARYLRDHEIRAVAICSSEGLPIGVIAQSDISDKVAAEHRCPSWVRVQEIMSQRLITVTPESGVEECLRLIEKHNIYHLVVVDGTGRSMGMISARDVLHIIASDQKARADLLQSWAFPSA